MSIGPIMLDLEGLALTPEEVDLLQHPMVGGIIFFARNYQTTDQIQALASSIRDIRPELLLSVDQEGGRVQRFTEGFTPLPAMQQFLPLFRRNPEAALGLVQNTGWLMAAELLAVGMDFSFAPVLDVDDHQCPVIANRSFSPDPAEVVVLASAFMAGMHEAGMATTGKHFPGHGSVSSDSHKTLPVDEREFKAIAANDLMPFVELQPQLDALMPAHILFPRVDEQQPVGFSSYWLQTILRKDLSFDGVIFSDDLSMAGAATAGNCLQRAELALVAGCDMVLICNDRSAALSVVDGLVFDHSVDSTQRLQSMAARQSISLADLHNEERWCLTQQLLKTLTAN